MSRRLLAMAFLVGPLSLFTAAGGSAHDGPAAKTKRAVYIVKHGDARHMADALAKHFKDDAEIQSVAGGSGQYLLVRADPAVVDEVIKLVADLDRRPRLVAVDLLIADAPAKAGADDKALEEAEFTGAAKDVLDRVQGLQKKGRLSGVKHLRFVAVEGQPTFLSVGESKAYTTGMAGVGRGGVAVARPINYRELGTVAKVTARVAAGNTIALDLDVSDSRMHVSDDGVVIGKDESGTPVRAPEFIMSQLKSRVSVPAGQAVAARDVRTTAKSGQGRTLVIAAARVVDPETGEGSRD
ncbi:MAG: hypothetical protein U0797_16050 [Gemmataceae bacterium]